MEWIAETIDAGRYEVGATSQPEPASPFDRLAVAVERIHELRKFSDAIADRLTGSRPENKAAADRLGVVAGGGLLDGLDHQTATIAELSRTIFDNLHRIQSRL